MSRTGNNVEICELTEGELEKVSGGQRELSEIIGAWYEALGALHLPMPSQGNSFTDGLRCNTE